MKKLFLLGLLGLGLAGSPSEAATDAGLLNFQGSIKGTSGTVVNKTMNMNFKLYYSEEGGSAVWAESFPVAVQEGFFNVYLGKDTKFQDQNIDFAKELWLEVTLDNGETLKRTRLSATPFAFNAISAVDADTANVAMDVVDGVLTWNNFEAAALKAGGALKGSYPNPTIDFTAVPQYSIPADRIAPGQALHIQASPAGPAYGDMEGSEFPYLYIKNDAVQSQHIANGAVGPMHLNTEGANPDDVLFIDAEGNATWGTVPTPLKKLGSGEVFGQMFYWNPTTNMWALTHDVAPENGQVMKWDANVNRFRWMDDDGFQVPFINDNVSTAGEDVIRLTKVDGTAGNMLHVINNNNNLTQNDPLVKIEGTTQTTFPNGVLEIDATVSTIHDYTTVAANITQHIAGSDNGQNSHALVVTNIVDDATDGSLHTGIKAFVNNVDTQDEGTNVAVLGYGIGNGSHSFGVSGFAGGADLNVGVYGGTGHSDFNDMIENIPAGITDIGVLAAVDGKTNPALFATASPAPGANYVAQIIVHDDDLNPALATGRGLYIENESVINGATFNPLSGSDNHDAGLVVRNTSAAATPAWAAAIGAEGKTAIKAFGDIWANSAVGATTLYAANQVYVGDPNGGYAIMTAPANAGDQLGISSGITTPSVSTGIVTTGNLNAGPSTLGPTTISGPLTVNAPAAFNAPVTVGAVLTTLGGDLAGTTATFSGTVGVAEPTAAGHATTKNYVDNLFTGFVANPHTWTGTQTFNDIVINDATVTGTNNLVLDGDVAGGSLAGTYPNPTIAATAGNNLVTSLNDAATTTTINATKLAATVVLDTEVPVGGNVAGNFATGLLVNSVQAAAGTSIVTSVNDAATVGTINANKLAATVVLDTETAMGGDVAGNFATGLLVNSVQTAAAPSIVTAINGSALLLDRDNLPAAIAYEDEPNTFTGLNTISELVIPNGGSLNITGSAVMTIGGTATVNGVLSPAGGFIQANRFAINPLEPTNTNGIDLYELATPFAPHAVAGTYMQFNGTNWVYNNIGNAQVTMAAGSDLAIGATNTLNNLDLQIKSGTVGTTELADLHLAPIGPIGAGQSIPVVTVDVDGRVTGLTSTALVESDPEVAMTTVNRNAKWNGTSLVDGSLTDNAGVVTVNGANQIGLNAVTGALTSKSAAHEVVTINGAAATDGLQMTNSADIVLASGSTIQTATAGPASVVEINDGLKVNNKLVLSNTTCAAIGDLANMNDVAIVIYTAADNAIIPANLPAVGVTAGQVMYFVNSRPALVTVLGQPVNPNHGCMLIFDGTTWYVMP